MTMDPLMYIDKIDAKKHILLVCDNAKKAREVEYLFIRRGLENKEKCVYFTHDDPKYTEYDMARHGIDVKYNKKHSWLQVYRMPNPLDDPESILSGVRNILKQILVNSKEQFRIVGRIIPNVGFEEAISVQLYLEKIFPSIFDDLNGSVICTYDFSQIKLNNNWRDWLEKLESYHHGSILRSNHRDVIKINYKDLN